ncbi:efflux RND transporter periplasmic adaptor subunit [Myxococcota bacterium]|nr:efflux RND transporter periplasmic adaptor subunit [Myxococcota bacterium]
MNACLLACDGGSGGKAGYQRPPTPVVVSSPFEHEFSDRLEAIGTAYANESVEITARVTKTVDRVLFEDGQAIRAGETLIELESTEEIAQLAQARANQSDAKLRFDRVADLAKSGTESQSRYDEVRTALDAANARVEEIEARLADLRIRAPFSGMLGLREVSPGTLVKPGDRITTLDDVDRIKLDFSVPETFLSLLTPGLPVRTQNAAFPGREFKGQVTAVDSRIDADTRAVRVRAEIENMDHAIRPGMLLSLVLEANPGKSLALAEQALVPTGSKQFVVVLDGENKPTRVEVEIGRRVPGLVEIRKGLTKESRVVIDGATLIPPGGMVEVLREETPGKA